MPDKNFLNIHVLISHSPSCLNRDDLNMQKSAVFGGSRRVRISSQCLKRAMRFSSYYAATLGQPSVRTRRLDQLTEKFGAALSDRYPIELVSRTIALVAGKEGIAAEAQADAVAPWSVSEVARLCELIQAADSEGLDTKKLEKRIADEVESLHAAIDGTVDIALSGRMATSGLMTKIDAALSLAHAITTHKVDADIDWFTAVDDLVAEEGDVGAGHLNTQEFGAGVFYRYGSLNLGQLQVNLGGASRARTLDIAAHLVHLLATVVPEAKQHTFAAYNPADLVLVSFGDLPISAANAFEEPVTRGAIGGFLKPSIAKFSDYITTVRTAYSLEEPQAVFSLWETPLEPRCQRLGDLENWVRTDGQGHPADWS